MTAREKITAINKAIDHLFTLAHLGVLSDAELMFLYNIFWKERESLRK